MFTLTGLFSECKTIANDQEFSYAKKWKSEDPSRVIVGMIPNYFPREILHASNALALGILGSENRLNEKDSSNCGHSKSCSMLDGVFELVNQNNLDDIDGFLLPSQCTPLQEIDEIKQIKEKCIFVEYINFPQYFQTIIGDILNHYKVHDVLNEIKKINNVEINAEKLQHSIQLYRNNLHLTEKIYTYRMKNPDMISQEDLFYMVTSGFVLPIEKHNEILNNIVSIIQETEKENQDDIFDVFSGAFC